MKIKDSCEKKFEKNLWHDKTLRLGIITNQDLLEFFGSQKNIIAYEKTKKVNNSMKKTLLNKASRYCNIVELGNGKYEILEIYDSPKPASLSKLKSGLYQYTSPLILLKLLNEHDENNKVVFPLLDWALFIDMVNKNYKPIKYNQREASEHLDINIYVIREFFEKVDDNIRYYIENTLRYLEQAGVLRWFKIPMVRKRVIERAYNTNSPDVYFVCDYVDVMATDEEIKFIHETEEMLEKKFGITSKSERYYGENAGKYREELYKALKTKDILYFYESYQVFYTSKERCQKLLDEFHFTSEKKLIKNFNTAFINLIVENAINRQQQEIVKEFLKEYRLDKNYITNFKLLSDLTINNKNKTNIVKEIIRDSKKKIKDKVHDDFNINIITVKGNTIL